MRLRQIPATTSGQRWTVPRRRLHVYHRRNRPAGAPVVVNLHGGGLYSGNKRREARPLIGYLAGR